MGEPKPLASLSSGLLARKGAARPAMRRQPLGSGMGHDAVSQDDLGWNDMGYDVDPAQSGEMARMVDMKPMLTNSLPHGGAGLTPVEPMPHQATAPAWYSGDGDEEGDDESGADYASMRSPLSVKPAVLQQQEALAARVAEAEVEPAPVVQQPASIQPASPLYDALEPDDIEEDAPVATPVPAPLPVAAAVAAVVPPAPIRRAPRARSEPKAREKAAFTLRLDAERHLRLRLASAVNHRSAQLIMIDLLDDYLASLPEIDAMASRLPATKANRL